MKLWEALEEWLFENDVGRFNSVGLAHAMNVPRPRASQMIQAYLDEQVKADSNSLYVLTRTGRTANTVWHVGVRTKDARRLGAQTVDDLKCRFERFVAPTLARIEQKNPRSVPAGNAILHSIEAALELLVSLGDMD